MLSGACFLMTELQSCEVSGGHTWMVRKHILQSYKYDCGSAGNGIGFKPTGESDHILKSLCSLHIMEHSDVPFPQLEILRIIQLILDILILKNQWITQYPPLSFNQIRRVCWHYVRRVSSKGPPHNLSAPRNVLSLSLIPTADSHTEVKDTWGLSSKVACRLLFLLTIWTFPE